jgi:hypothetical protein
MRKQIQGVQVKDAEQGLVLARIATLNVKDRDGDVILPGFFPEEAPVRISAFNHASWGGALPVGKGVVRADDKEALFEGRFFLDTSAGLDTFRVVKEMGELQEWSWGFDIRPGAASEGEHEGESVRLLGPAPDGGPGGVIHEVSPVLLGASIGTATLAVKAEAKGPIPSHSTPTTDERWDAAAAVAEVDADAASLRAIHAWVDPDGDPDAKSSYKFPHHAAPGAPANLRACAAVIAALNGGRGGADIPDEDRQGVWEHVARHLRDADREPPELRSKRLTFLDEAAHALAGVDALILRAAHLGSLRAASEGKEGRVPSAANRERLAALMEALGQSMEEIRTLLEETDPDKHAVRAAAERARFEFLTRTLS